jgi:hypothetical protein
MLEHMPVCINDPDAIALHWEPRDLPLLVTGYR